MAERSTYRTQYEHRVAELGDDEIDTVDEAEVTRAYKTLSDAEDDLEVTDSEVARAQEIVDRYLGQLAAIRRARLQVCAHARDKDDAHDLMEYLGIAPGQPVLPSKVYFGSSSMHPDAKLRGTTIRKSS
jgi:hypothetical protein